MLRMKIISENIRKIRDAIWQSCITMNVMVIKGNYIAVRQYLLYFLISPFIMASCENSCTWSFTWPSTYEIPFCIYNTFLLTIAIYILPWNCSIIIGNFTFPSITCDIFIHFLLTLGIHITAWYNKDENAIQTTK